jgi:hypothetical protein
MAEVTGKPKLTPFDKQKYLVQNVSVKKEAESTYSAIEPTRKKINEAAKKPMRKTAWEEKPVVQDFPTGEEYY